MCVEDKRGPDSCGNKPSPQRVRSHACETLFSLERMALNPLEGRTFQPCSPGKCISAGVLDKPQLTHMKYQRQQCVN